MNYFIKLLYPVIVVLACLLFVSCTSDDDNNGGDDDIVDDDVADDDIADDDMTDDDAVDDDAADDDTADDYADCEPHVYAFDGFEDYPILKTPPDPWTNVQGDTIIVTPMIAAAGFKSLWLLHGLEIFHYWIGSIDYHLPEISCPVTWFSFDAHGSTIGGNLDFLIRGLVGGEEQPTTIYTAESIYDCTLEEEWSHFAVRFDRESQAVEEYCNGELTHQGVLPPGEIRPMVIQFGSGGESGIGGFWPGALVDNLAIYDDGVDEPQPGMF